MTPDSTDAATEVFRQFMAQSEILALIVSGLAVAGITSILVFFRKLIALPKEMVIIKAAMFRMLRSNKIQGVALTTIAQCQKEQKYNGNTDIAVQAVKTDQEKIDDFLRAAALGKVDPLDEVLK